MNAPQKHYIIISVLALGFLCSCSRPDLNSNKINMVSAKGYGMIVTKIVTHKDSLTSLETKTDIDTLRVYHNEKHLKGFYGIPFSELPNYITFQYQYAEVAESFCNYKEKKLDIIWMEDFGSTVKGEIEKMSWKKARVLLSRGAPITLLNDTIVAKRGENRLLLIEKEFAKAPFYFSKRRCTKYEPIDGMKFTRTINLKPYNQKIKLYRKNNKGFFGPSLGAALTYNFYDNGEIKVYLKNYKYNSFSAAFSK